jgi:hypothetical protein
VIRFHQELAAFTTAYRTTARGWSEPALAFLTRAPSLALSSPFVSSPPPDVVLTAALASLTVSETAPAPGPMMALDRRSCEDLGFLCEALAKNSEKEVSEKAVDRLARLTKALKALGKAGEKLGFSRNQAKGFTTLGSKCEDLRTWIAGRGASVPLQRRPRDSVVMKIRPLLNTSARTVQPTVQYLGPQEDVLRDITARLRPPPDDEQRNNVVLARLENALTHRFPTVRVCLFGSRGSGFALGRTSDLDVSLHLPSLQDIHERILNEYIDARTQMDRLEEEEPEAVRLLVVEEELRAKLQRKAAKIAKDRGTLKRERKQYDTARGELAELERRSGQQVLAANVAASKKAAADRRVELDKRQKLLDKEEDNLEEREEAQAELGVMVRAARRELEIVTDDKLVRRVAVLRQRLEESDVKQMDEKKIIQEIAKCFRSAKVMVTTVIQRCRVPIVKVKVLDLLPGLQHLLNTKHKHNTVLEHITQNQRITLRKRARRHTSTKEHQTHGWAFDIC